MNVIHLFFKISLYLISPFPRKFNSETSTFFYFLLSDKNDESS